MVFLLYPLAAGVKPETRQGILWLGRDNHFPLLCYISGISSRGLLAGENSCRHSRYLHTHVRSVHIHKLP